MKKRRIGIVGPYTGGNVAINVRAAINAAEQVMDLNCLPYVPHLTHFQHIVHPRSYEDWMELDASFLSLCDALLRLPGKSPGADREVEMALRLFIPVFYTVEALKRAEEALTADKRRTKYGF